jgi:hypothetical protein
VSAISCEGALNGLKQGIFFKWFAQICDNASLLGVETRLFIRACRDYDDWQSLPRDGQMVKKVEARHPGHLHIEHQASDTLLQAAPQEFLGGGVGHRSKSR